MENLENIANEVAKNFDAKAKTFESKVEEVKSAFDAKLNEKDTVIEGLKSEIKVVADRAEQLDQLFAKKDAETKKSVKSIGEQLMEGVDNEMVSIEKSLKSQSGSFTLNLKAVGNMLLSSNLTGDSVATYNQRQAILPAQAINCRV